MEPATVDAALLGLRPLLAEPARVKLFGGEPLLRPDLVARAADLLDAVAPGTPLELPTHGGGLPAVAGLLSRRKEIEVFCSRASAAAGTVPGAAHNLLIPPGESPARTARRLVDARRMGFARVNFLPAYFVAWTPEQLRGLDVAFQALGSALDALARAGRGVEVLNLSRRGAVPLYNDGLTVDVDGTVYASNLVLAGAVRPRRGELRLGVVDEPELLRERPAAEPARVVEESFPPEVLAGTRAADEALTRFCLGLEPGPGGATRKGCGGRSGGGTSLAG
jgi:hypothetical protein